MKMFIAGSWIDKPDKVEVRNPFDGSVIDSVPKADEEDVRRAIDAAGEGAATMRRLSGYDRAAILKKAADLMQKRSEELGRLISTEEGKIIAEGRFEASRAIETIIVSSEEAKRL